ncbi:peptidase s41 [Litoribacter alkaliphilus]|uniref:Peptidase s41 n=1 Tax=Litoribacter ruber TaxID=702568 RepID=A0AAP2G280_9BACT|nr:S41 family peptidase [Litoribacter alkaliphilus]MBS9525739.1 peptidase s41 [Litoribacter alkaliphilus]
MKHSFTLLLIFIIFSSFGQKEAEIAENLEDSPVKCSCGESFDALAVGVEQNYSLFQFKVTDNNREIYTAFTAVMRQQAETTSDFEECKKVLNTWLGFFRDGHMWLNFQENGEVFNERVVLGEDNFKKRFVAEAESEDLLGIWESGSYRVAIIPEEDPVGKRRDFVGVILESKNPDWHPDEVKFTLQKVYGNDYKATFYLGDRRPKSVESKLKNAGLLQFEGLNEWYKVWPEDQGSLKVQPETLAYEGFHFEMLNGEVPYFRFPSFSPSSIESLEKVLEEYHEQLVKASFMVVDVRQNSGGYDYVYYPLMPYILSGPIEMPNVYHYLSAYNKTQMGAEVAEEDVDELEDEEEKAMYKLFYSSMDTLLAFGGETYTYNPDTLYTQPRRIAVLTSDKTISSGETFVLRAKKSSRVTVYGQNTAGIIDGFNGAELELGCVTLRYPLSVRSLDVDTNPIDPYGIAPDVFLDKSEDVLEFALLHMRQLIENE